MVVESRKAIYAAIGANLAIAVTKFIAASFTRSSAMISEGIHSLVDTGNGGLLLLGIKRSQKPADAAHPFGHGKEVYFWTLIVAIMIFAVGGGVSAYEGLLHILHPEPIANPMWNYIVLGLAIVFEGYSFTVAFRAFQAIKGDQSIWHSIHTSKDPTTFTVLFEDTAALLGLIVALAGIYLAQAFNNPYFDGAASIVIGAILALVAVLLAYESKGLLIGEGADPETIRNIRRMAESDPCVERVSNILTMHFGPNSIMLVLDLELGSGLSAAEVKQAVDRIEKTIRKHYPDVKHVFTEFDSVPAKPVLSEVV